MTKVWINCVVRRATTCWACIGTGIDLSTFIRMVVARTAGVGSLFVADGAIQAYARASRIECHR